MLLDVSAGLIWLGIYLEQLRVPALEFHSTVVTASVLWLSINWCLLVIGRLAWHSIVASVRGDSLPAEGLAGVLLLTFLLAEWLAHQPGATSMAIGEIAQNPATWRARWRSVGHLSAFALLATVGLVIVQVRTGWNGARAGRR